MATKLEPDIPTTPTNDDVSDGDDQDSVDENNHSEEEDPPKSNVADILKRLQSSGAIIKKPKQEYHCYTCEEDFRNWEELEKHLIQHVSQPSVILDRLPSDDEDIPSGDEEWSDEEETTPSQTSATPKKLDISQILTKTGISIKKPGEGVSDSNSALNKLSGLGFIIKKNSVPIKNEPEPEQSNSNDNVLQKLGKLGAIKLKLKSDGGNTNSFKVVNGLKDFKPSDDEEDSGDEGKSIEDNENDEENRVGEHDGSDEDSFDEKPDNVKEDSDSSDKTPRLIKKIANTPKIIQNNASIVNKAEPKTPEKPSPKEVPSLKPVGRPAIKQTPKRGANLPIASKEIKEASAQSRHSAVTPERRESHDTTMENITIKKEVDTGDGQATSPLFSGEIKTERSSPPPFDSSAAPGLAKIKTEPESTPSNNSRYSHTSDSSQSSSIASTAVPLLPVAKSETESMTIIEINGDSNDEDDDCCVVSSTPAPDVKPLVPKTESSTSLAFPPPPPLYPAVPGNTQANFSSASSLNSRAMGPNSLEKQHNFNWNAPDSKPPIDMLEKSADDIFESLLSNNTKKENSLSDANEYISLDTLGPQHSCDVCNTRFTSISLLDDHRRATGHSRSLVMPISSSSILPYNQPSSILSSLLPVKQIAEQVGKLSTIGSAPGFTHQQNVMINIQAYPGGGGVMSGQQQYGYPGQNVPQGAYPQPTTNMYSGQGQTMPGQYPNQNYMGQQGYGQYQQPMPKPGFPSTLPQNTYSPSTPPYSTTSPLQGMQQAVYGQSPGSMINSPMGQMGPPTSIPNNPYAPSSPGGTMKPPTPVPGANIRIQNVQTFQPGQIIPMAGQTTTASDSMTGPPPAAPGQVVGGQMTSPNQIRMAVGANVGGLRPRMPSPRGPRPGLRPGIQVHGQVRGVKPGTRLPMKRPGAPGSAVQKKRPNMLLPGKHDNEDCHVMAMQKQREGLPLIQSVQGANNKLNFGSQISVTKKTVNKEANAMASVLASRGISVKQKQKSRSPTPERPIPHIPNLGAGVSIKHTSKSSNFSIPEATVGSGGMHACKICKKMFMNQNSLGVHMSNAHPQNKLPVFKCEECPAAYPKILQLQSHKRVFHNITGPNRELGLPVVDLSQEDTLKRLSNIGIYSFIPLANREQATGCFGIPVISVHNAQNGVTNGLTALGADGLLSLGPLKPLPNT